MHELARLARAVHEAGPPRLAVGGVVAEAASGVCRVRGLSRHVGLGDCVSIDGRLAEVIRIDGDGLLAKSFDALPGAGVGTRVLLHGAFTLRPDISWRGRIVDALGRPVDGLGRLASGDRAVAPDRAPPASMRRQRTGAAVPTGVRVLDVFTPLCLGQRIGVFAGSGVGKSTLMAMLARAGGFDTVVIALVGERGREVREFVEDALGAGRERAVTVVATGDESAMMRRQAPQTAMMLAEYFRDMGDRVLLVVDSITRFAHAARDVALAAGEPPVARGYPPSVFGDLPRLLERAGPGEAGAGSITGVFAVLVDGDDLNDPVADAIRGTLDGHIVLDRAIADRGRYPAVDVLASISRLARGVWTDEQRALVARLRAMIARYEDTADLRVIGGYKPGGDAELDRAVALVPAIYRALEQDLAAPPSADPFRELAEVLRGGTRGEGAAGR